MCPAVASQVPIDWKFEWVVCCDLRRPRYVLCAEALHLGTKAPTEGRRVDGDDNAVLSVWFLLVPIHTGHSISHYSDPVQALNRSQIKMSTV